MRCVFALLLVYLIVPPVCAADYDKELRLKAEQGDAGAQNYLGDKYFIGEGVSRDYVKALKWYTKAAEQGVLEAQDRLGFMYRTRDVIRAYMWYNVASTNGFYLASEHLDSLENHMTPQQIKKAQFLAKQCIAKHYKGC